MKLGNVKSAILVTTISLILVISQLPTIAFAAPAQNEKFGTPVGATLLTIINDDLFSTADLTLPLDPTGKATQHYGPYASGSPDSGTCGNDWATDTFDRHFTVFTQQDGSFLVVEQFKDGNFVTPAPLGDPARTPNGPSPGACQTSPIPAGTVNDGITGSLHGYFIISLPPGTMQTSSDPHCDAATMSNTDCNTTMFIDTHFTPCYGTGVCSVSTFFFHYAASDQSLIQHQWKNASSDRGGNSGDIRSTNL
jgi:hypothetical protein